MSPRYLVKQTKYTNDVYNKLQIRVLKRAKDVYAGAGLQKVHNVINHLKMLVGDPPLPIPGYGDWSIREVITLSNLAIGPNGFSLRSFAVFMITTLPLDTPYPSPNVDISFRRLLTVFDD